MTETEQRILGRLEASIQNLTSLHERDRAELREKIRLLFDEIQAVRSTQAAMAIAGCAVGKANAERIKALEDRPEKLIGIGAAAVAICSALGSFVLWLFNHAKVGP